MSKLYKGIDISYYQGDVDFEKVKEQRNITRRSQTPSLRKISKKPQEQIPTATHISAYIGIIRRPQIRKF